MKDIRSFMDIDEVIFRSYQIYNSLISVINFKKVKTISCYIDFKNEVYTRLFIMHCLESKIKIALPRVCKDKIILKYIDNLGENLENSPIGILEPIDSLQECEVSQVDLFIIPALAYDELGNRIGYGKGYYDKLLAKNREALRIGVAYTFQVLPKLPYTDKDEIVDMIVSEHRIVAPYM